MNPADESYARHKAPAAVQALIRNAAVAHDHRYALGPARDRAGTAVVVGAGPSLSRTGHLVAQWQRAGALVLCPNTAARAVGKWCTPDVVLAREVVDVSSHLDAFARCLVLDLAASPAVWRAARESGRSVQWFVAGGLQWFAACALAGVRPLYGGPAALTACVELAREWGARQVVLVGVDCAFADDGLGYADGSAFAGYRGTLDGEHVRLGGEGWEVMRAQSERGGIVPPPERQSVTSLPAYGGAGTVRALYTWADQVRWLETFASRWGGVLSLVDATGSGARKAGWVETHDVAATRLPLPRGVEVSREQTQAIRDDALRQADTMRALAATVVDPDGAPSLVPGFLDGCDLVEANAAGRMLDVRARGLGPREAVRETYRVLGESAEEVRAAVLQQDGQ